MSEPFTFTTYELTLARPGTVVTVEARGMETAIKWARKEWRRDIGGEMPDVTTVTIIGARYVITGDSTPRVIEAKVPA